MALADTAPIAHDLKQALRRLVRSVVVISAHHEGRPYAITATAVSEVSLTPPSMLFCVNRGARIFPAISQQCDVALNILTVDHEPVSRACGGDVVNEERFAIGDWEIEPHVGPPLLRTATAVIVLTPTSFLDHGSHRVVIGNVRQVLIRDGAGQALVYADGAYGQVSTAAALSRVRRPGPAH